MKKKTTRKMLRKIVTPTFVKAIILLFPITFLIVYKAARGDLTLETFVSIDTFSAIILAFLCQIIADKITKGFERQNEDSLKLTEDHQTIVKKYERSNLLHFESKAFPAICLALRNCSDRPFQLVFDDSAFNKKYQLPSQIAQNSDTLMQAHKHSSVYNQLNIRLDNLKQIDNRIVLSYSQTTYYDSLITNRAMDYCWNNGKTIREIYEPGPFISDLENSKFSNHLGFNGFLETSDGKIVFVKRGQKLSVGKNTWSPSVAASLKAKYALDENQKFDKQGLSEAIKKEITDELYIEFDQDTDLSESIFAFYRDLVEGGKPQFLFYFKFNNYTFNEFQANFYAKYKKKNNVVDGTKFIGLSIDECRNSELTCSGILHKNNFYKMTASSASSLAMLFKHLELSK